MGKAKFAFAVLAVAAGLLPMAASPAVAEEEPPGGGAVFTYQLKSDKGNCLDVGPGKPQDGTLVRTWSDCNRTANQKWRFESSGPESVNLVHHRSGLCATREENSNGDTVVRLRVCGDQEDSQDWQRIPAQGNPKQFQNAEDGGYLYDNGSGSGTSTTPDSGSYWTVSRS
ncbi:RICIN domain-containing protein [Streptomyces sp. NPDC018019]|uniref:RICIN domain-containing protein n=1 Tax=Streptomyces sp. NPDC018019 TaxID=3365030 RepID=UPI00379F190D